MRPALSWSDGLLRVDMPGLPGSPLHVHYLEACLRGAHVATGEDRHPARTRHALCVTEALWLRDTLAD
jgi:hypothetical protein